MLLGRLGPGNSRNSASDVWGEWDCNGLYVFFSAAICSSFSIYIYVCVCDFYIIELSCHNCHKNLQH